MFLTIWADAKIQKLDWLDISLIKISVAGFVLMIAKLWEPLLILNWYWYALILVLAVLRPMFKIFSK